MTRVRPALCGILAAVAGLVVLVGAAAALQPTASSLDLLSASNATSP